MAQLGAPRGPLRGGTPGVQSTPPHSRRASVVRRKLLLGQVVGLTAAFVLLQVTVGSNGTGGDHVPIDGEVLLFVASLPLWIVLARASGLYSRDEERPEQLTVDDFVGVFQLLTTCVWLIFVVAAITNVASPDIEKWIIFWFLAFVFVSSARSIARLLARRSSDYAQNAVVVGTDKTAQLIARKIVQHPHSTSNLWDSSTPPAGAASRRGAGAHRGLRRRPDRAY